METKLTLKLKAQVIEKAKDYASAHKISLSKLIENYLSNITTEKEEKLEISPLVKSLSGIIDLPNNRNYKEEYKGHIIQKYK